MEKRKEDLIGQVFFDLVVIKHHYSNLWLCRCICGENKIVSSSKLKSGHTKSCGCRRKKHGFWNTKYSEGTMKFYKMWQSLKARCDNSNLKCYKNYGGRGIIYDPRWKDFLEFKKDMYFKYLYATKQQKIKQPSIERVNVNGNYCKNNCTFIEHIDQLGNQRTTITFIAISPDGKKILEKNVNAFCRKYDLPSTCVYRCLNKKGKLYRGWKFIKR